MERFFKATAVGLVGCILALIVQKQSKEQAMLLNLLTAAVLAAAFLTLLRPVTEIAEQLEEATGLDSALITPVYKCLGIGVIAQLSASACKDAGSSAVSESIQLLGTAAALYCAAPLILALLTLIRELLGG